MMRKLYNTASRTLKAIVTNEKSSTVRTDNIFHKGELTGVSKYNSIGQRIYRYHKGVEYWKEFHRDGSMVLHTKDSKGYESWRTFDRFGLEIYRRDSEGSERWTIYNAKKKIHSSHYKTSTGYEEWCNYDSSGNVIHLRASDGYEWWRVYNSDNKEIYYRNSKYEIFTEYFVNSKKTHFKSKRKEEIRIYNLKGDIIHRDVYNK